MRVCVGGCKCGYVCVIALYIWTLLTIIKQNASRKALTLINSPPIFFFSHRNRLMNFITVKFPLACSTQLCHDNRKFFPFFLYAQLCHGRVSSFLSFMLNFAVMKFFLISHNTSHNLFNSSFNQSNKLLMLKKIFFIVPEFFYTGIFLPHQKVASRKATWLVHPTHLHRYLSHMIAEHGILLVSLSWVRWYIYRLYKSLGIICCKYGCRSSSCWSSEL